MVVHSEGAQKRDQVIVFLLRQADLEACIVEIDNRIEIGSETVVEVGCAGGEGERAPDDRYRMSDAQWGGLYRPELDNVRAALDWAFGAGGAPAIGIALAGGSGPLWTNLVIRAEGQRRLEAALAWIGPQIPELDQARLWLWLGILLGEAIPVQAVAAKERAVGIYRRLGETPGLGLSLVQLGHTLPLLGRVEEAKKAFAEAFPLLEQAGLPTALGRCFECFGLMLYRSAGAELDALNALSNIADVTWALGDLDGATVSLRQTVALVRKLPGPPSGGRLGLPLINLAGVLTERGELDEALVAAREALPLLTDGGYAWSFLDHVALRAAMAGKVANAARVAGHADSTFAAKKTSRQFNEARAHERLHALLREKLHPAELERLLAEGAKMSEDHACRLALEL